LVAQSYEDWKQMHSSMTTLTRLRSVLSLANRDFCPGANKYVYWLKEPVGWFVVALAVSLLVGAFLSPLGWTVAAGLCAILVFGLGLPWLATRTLVCELRPLSTELHEGESSELELEVRNRLPLPILGLMVEGYLTLPLSDFGVDSEQQPDVGLARVPPLSTATYRLVIRPEYRGHYPAMPPSMTCSFPFGIWTARRVLGRVTPVTVWPMLIPIDGLLEFTGSRLSEVGTGLRPSTHGDFLGVRAFRRGDSLKSIHWVQSARLDELIVCERGGPQQQAVEVHLSTARCQGSRLEARENLAWRVRIAASFIDLLVSRHLPFQLFIDGERQSLPEDAAGRRLAWDRLAQIPLDTSLYNRPSLPDSRPSRASRIRIAACQGGHQSLPAHQVQVDIQHASQGIRDDHSLRSSIIDLDQDIAHQLNHLLAEATHASIVA
jgi:uncharacterized protein (DUF58 family)